MASCVVLCRGLGACGCVSVPRRKNGLFCAQVFYITLLLDFRPGETSGDLQRTQRKADAVVQNLLCSPKCLRIFDTPLEQWMNSLLLLCCVMFLWTVWPPQLWKKTFSLMNNWWSHSAQPEVYCCLWPTTWSLYCCTKKQGTKSKGGDKVMDGGREDAAADKQSKFLNFRSISQRKLECNFLSKLLPVLCFLSHCAWAHTTPAFDWGTFYGNAFLVQFHRGSG